MDEFNLIKEFFQRTVTGDVVLGIGDDCAITQVPADKQLAITTDILVAGVHFPADTSPEDIAYKTVAVNLSDLAAMGAEPAWLTLNLTIPEFDKTWLEKFRQGFFNLLDKYRVSLIGGDTTRGPLNVSCQATGFLPKQGNVLRRDQAQVGDAIYVTGQLGAAAYGLHCLQHELTVDPVCLQKLNRPTPRVEIGIAMRDIAHAAVDISDGLAADLSHILAASSVGATIYSEKLPLNDTLAHCGDANLILQCALAEGDDYELCFTLAPEYHESLLQIARQYNCAVTCIGQIEAQSGLRIIDAANNRIDLSSLGYRHF